MIKACSVSSSFFLRAYLASFLRSVMFYVKRAWSLSSIATGPTGAAAFGTSLGFSYTTISGLVILNLIFPASSFPLVNFIILSTIGSFGWIVISEDTSSSIMNLTVISLPAISECVTSLSMFNLVASSSELISNFVDSVPDYTSILLTKAAGLRNNFKIWIVSDIYFYFLFLSLIKILFF